MDDRFLSRRTKGMLFGAQISDPVVMREFSYENYPEYHQDDKSDARVLFFMKRFVQCFRGNIYLLVTDNKMYLKRLPQPVNRIFIHSPLLEKLERLDIEVDVGEAWPLSMAIVDLEAYDYEIAEELLFGSFQSTFIFSCLSKEHLANRVSQWIFSYEKESLLSFNRDAMVQDLEETDKMAFFSYGPSHNRHYESMVVVGPGQYVDQQVVPCIEEACSDQNVIKYTDNFVPDN